MSKNIHQRLNLVRSKVTSVYKNVTVQMGGGRGYSAVSHDDVTALIHVPLVDAGVSVEVDLTEAKIEQITEKKEAYGKIQEVVKYMASCWVSVSFVNEDDISDRFTVKSFGYAFDQADKAMGKAQSMAVKYVYLKNLVLESQDNEEERSEYIHEQPRSGTPRNSGTSVNASAGKSRDVVSDRSSASPVPSRNADPQSSSSDRATDAQVRAVKMLYGNTVKTESISKNEASELIRVGNEKLKNSKNIAKEN